MRYSSSDVYSSKKIEPKSGKVHIARFCCCSFILNAVHPDVYFRRFREGLLIESHRITLAFVQPATGLQASLRYNILNLLGTYCLASIQSLIQRYWRYWPSSCIKVVRIYTKRTVLTVYQAHIRVKSVAERLWCLWYPSAQTSSHKNASTACYLMLGSTRYTKEVTRLYVAISNDVLPQGTW